MNSVRRNNKFSKLGIPIYNSKVPHTAVKKIRRERRKHAVAKRFSPG